MSIASQLRIGTKVELEHTRSRRVARKIALDHLKEFPDYYTRLLKMERIARRYWRRRRRNPGAAELAASVGTTAVTSGAGRLLGFLGAGAIFSRLGRKKARKRHGRPNRRAATRRSRRGRRRTPGHRSRSRRVR